MQTHALLKHGWTMLFLSMGLSASAQAIDWQQQVQRGQLLPPEQELRYAADQLETISQQLNSERIVENPTPLTALHNAERFFQMAQDSFGRKECQTAVSYFKLYFSTAQNVAVNQALTAKYQSGICYEQLHQTAAAKQQYTQYVATYMTQQRDRDPELMDVLERLLPMLSREDTNLRQLLSPLRQMQIVDKYKAEILLLGGLALLKTRDEKEAKDWLEAAQQLSQDPRVKAQAIVTLGEWQLRNRDFDGAKKQFEDVLKLSGDSTKEFVDRAHLGKARLLVLQQYPQEALAYYDRVSPDFSAYKDAYFEKTLVLAELGKFPDSLKSAQEFQQKYPYSPDYYQLRALLPYLELKTGDLSNARQHIDAYNGQLSGMDQWIRKELLRKDQLTYRDLYELQTRTKDFLQEPAPITTSMDLFLRLAKTEQRLANLRSLDRSLVYTMARLQWEQITPELEQRTAQLDKQFQELMLVGHRLMTAQKEVLSKQLSEKDKSELEASEKRRFMVLSRASQHQNQKGEWSNLKRYLDLHYRISQINLKVKDQKALLASTSLGALTMAPKNANDTLRAAALLQRRAQLLEGQLQKAFAITSARTTHYMVAYAPPASLLKTMRTYALSLSEEAAVTERYLDQADKPHLKALNTDFQKTWARWENVTKALYSQVQGLRGQAEGRIRDRLAQVQNQFDWSARIESEILQLNRQLEANLGSQVDMMLAPYFSQIADHRARHQKWLAEIDWHSFEKSKGAGEQTKKQIDLDQQILNDRQRNHEQGATLPWQK